MEPRQIQFKARAKSKSRNGVREQGFALVSLLAVLPVLLAVVAALATTFMALRRKSLAQSLCVQHGMQLQLALKKPLTALTKMNRKATSLRAARRQADRALASATAAGYPPAIAAAAAVQKGVVLQQLALRSSQEFLLGEARALRLASSRELDLKLKTLPVSPVRGRQYFSRALAVRPVPATSLTPDYEPVADFTTAQQQRFSFDLNLLTGIPAAGSLSEKQKTECSISLKAEGDGWKIQIVAARAP